MNDQKNLMAEIALLYYKKGLTQQEIANALQLTRQTVSKLLASAVDEKIVEIIIHNPKAEREELERKLKERYGIKAVVCGASRNSDELRQLVTTEGAIRHLLPILSKGNLRIAVSWGRSVQNVIKAFPTTPTKGNVVFPLFGATEHEQTYFLPNELAREFSAKLEADVKFAWFPYKPENERDFDLFKRTDYYRQMQCDWERLDVAIIGIGNNQCFKLLNASFEEEPTSSSAIGDVATHFFALDGALIQTNELTLRISAEQLKAVKEKIAVAYGDDKTQAIVGAINAGFVDTLITDEYTAKLLLDFTK